MAVIPTGLLSKPVDNCRTLLANVEAVRTFLGAADVAAAEAMIYTFFAAASVARPLIVIGLPQGEYGFERTGENAWLPVANGLEICFERAVPEEYQADGSEVDAMYDFTNLVGAAVEGIAELAGTDAYFNVVALTLQTGPGRATFEDKTGRGDFMQCVFRAEWQ